MDSLLRSLDNEFKKANKNIKEIKQSVQPEQEKSVMGSSSSQYPSTYSHVERYGPQISFSKSQRFPAPVKNAQDEFSPSPCSYLLPTQISTTSCKFNESNRFEKQETDYTCYSINYSQSSKEKNIIGGCIGKAIDSNLEEMDEVETQWDESGVGPQGYAVNYSLIERSIIASNFNKSDRFKKEKPKQPIIDEQEELNEINYDLVKKRQPATIIHKDTEKNDYQLKKYLTEQQMERQAAIAYNQKDLMDLDKAIREKPQNIILNTNAQRTDKERIRLLIDAIEKRRREAILGPGRYEIIKEKKQKDFKFGIVYRRNSVEIRRINKERRPGPQSYQVNDNLIHDNPQRVLFNKSEREKRQKRITLEGLDLNYNLVTKRIQVIEFRKEKQNYGRINDKQIINQRADEIRGPQTYNINYKITEKREGIGIIEEKKKDEIEQFRENMMEKQMINENTGDPGGEIINTKLTKPQHSAAYTYHQPINQKPEHIPDKELFPEHWKFYNKDNGELPELAGKLFPSKETFEKNEEEMYELKWLLGKFRKQPEVGQYDPEKIQPHIADIYFSKMKNRDAIQDEPGEELLLDPQKPQVHIREIKFEQMLGRDDNTDEKNELIIERDYNQVDKKIKGFVEMDKQLVRKDDNEQQQETCNIEPNYELVQEKQKKGAVDFDRMQGRDFELKKQEEAMDIDPDAARDKLKQTKNPQVHMDKGGERFPEKEIYNPPGQTTEEIIDYQKAIDATKPRAVGMQEFKKGKLKDFRIGESKIKKKSQENSKQQLESVQEDNNNQESFQKYEENKELQRIKGEGNNNNLKQINKKQNKKSGKVIPNKSQKIQNNHSVGPWKNNPSNLQQQQQQ